MRSPFNFINVFSLFPYHLHFEKSVAFHLINLEFPSPKGALCQVWLNLDQWFWRRRCTMWKVYDNDDAQRTNFDQKLGFGSGELSTTLSGVSAEMWDKFWRLLKYRFDLTYIWCKMLAFQIQLIKRWKSWRLKLIQASQLLLFITY